MFHQQLALPLEATPRAVASARLWVAGVCRDLQRSDVVECARLGVSELVTNALLHAEAPITVSVRSHGDVLRIEVADGTRDIPVVPLRHRLADLLTPFGRGLDIVARCSTAWGAALSDRGKVVWFEPARQPQEDGLPEAAVVDLASGPSTGEAPGRTARVRLLGVPVAEVLAQRDHYLSLTRELRLLALRSEQTLPLAREFTRAWDAFARTFPEEAWTDAEAALATGAERFDIDAELAADAGPVFTRVLDLLDEADRLCVEEKLLSLARTPEQRAFQTWYLGEYVAQLAGAAPTPWPGLPTPAESALTDRPVGASSPSSRRLLTVQSALSDRPVGACSPSSRRVMTAQSALVGWGVCCRRLGRHQAPTRGSLGADSAVSKRRLGVNWRRLGGGMSVRRSRGPGVDRRRARSGGRPRGRR